MQFQQHRTRCAFATIAAFADNLMAAFRQDNYELEADVVLGKEISVGTVSRLTNAYSPVFQMNHANEIQKRPQDRRYKAVVHLDEV